MLVGRTGLSPVMVGRTAELDRLVAMVGTRPEPAVALVAGEAGIGKTRLVQELVSRVADTAVVLAGQADPGSSGRPMELFLDALEGARAADREATRPTGGGAPTGGARPDGAGGDEQGTPAPDGRNPEGPWATLLATARDPARPPDERVLAAVELVRRRTAGVPGVVVFEDLHWADAESVSVFEQLAEPSGGRLLVVGTYRPDGLARGHPASELLPRLERRHSVTHIQLGRLSPGDVGTFLHAVDGRDPSYRVVEALHGRTGGNPFFLEALVASSGPVPAGELAVMPLPWTVAELIRTQVDELDDEVRRIVTAASVLGRRVSFDLLAAVTRTSEDDLIGLLRAAVDSGLLVEADPDVFGFRHEIAREAIQGALLGRERRRLHEAALDALRRAGSADHAVLAHHARGAGRYDDLVAEARLGVHEALARGSSFQALHLAELALTEAEDDIDLLCAAARSAWLADLVDDAAAHADRWLRVARTSGDIEEEAAALSVRMRVDYEMGDLEALAMSTDELIAVVDRLPTEAGRAEAMASIAQSYMLRDLVEPTCDWADKARALAESHDLPRVRIASLVEKGSMLMTRSETLPEGRALIEEAADEAERTGEHVLAARALNNLVWHARQWSEPDDVRALIERMGRHAQAAGFDSLANAAQIQARAQLAAVEGDLDRAMAFLDDGRRRPSTSRTRGPRLAVLRAGLALEAGDLDGAACFTEQAKPVSQRTAIGVLGLDLHLALRLGDLVAGRRLLADMVAAVTEEGFADAAQVHDLVSAALAAGLAPEEMRPLVEWIGADVGHRLPAQNAWRRLIDGQLAEAEGRAAEAARLYDEASTTLRAAHGVLAGHQGTAHVGAARTLVALGRIDEARAHAARAAALLARWRGWRVDDLRAVERRLGIGDAPDGPVALTGREREVAALLAEGLTNAQLADRLVISPRTAAVHVSNILTKLGMASRAEVAAWAVREGLARA